jgi:hypothetical protein
MLKLEKQYHDAFIKVVSNRKRNDKHSLGYLIGMIKGTCIESIYSSDYKREELLKRLIALSLTEKGWNRLMSSNYLVLAIELELLETK